MICKSFRKSVFILFFLFQACIPTISKSIMQSVSDYLQLKSILNTGPYTISVKVSGLLGSGLTLSLNSGQATITVNSDGDYQFGPKLLTGENFNVTITNQPILPNQTCSINGGMGVVGFGNIATIIVNCDPLRYSIGGTISGLDGVTGLVLTNSFDGSTLSVAVASGTFAFTQTYVSGSTYNVSVTTQPNHPVQNCVVTNPSGTIASANITNIAISCTSTAYPIEITSFGIGSGTLILSNNGSETISITTNGINRFATDLPPSSTYNVQIVSVPTNHQCVLSSTSGTVAGTVSIQANCFSVLDYTPRNGGILQTTESIRLVFSAEVNTGSCAGSSGTLNTNLSFPINFALATTNFTNDTLVVSPAPTDSWVTGNRSLVLNCLSNIGSHPLSTSVTLTYLVPSTLRYVSDASGNDVNDGLTPATPKRNIQPAIDSFGGCPSNDCAVLVTQGSYDPAAVSARIQLVSGISLFGSYEPGFTQWKPTDKDSTILMDMVPAFCATANSINPCASIAADSSVTATTIISGFKILSGDNAPYMTGVFLDSTNSVRIIDNTINGGTGTSVSSGIYAINSTPILIRNQIEGGICTANNCNSSGVYMTSAALIAPFIVGNTIDSGNGTGTQVISRGIFYNGSVGLDVTNIRLNQITSLPLDNTTAGTSTLSIAFDISSLSNSSTGVLAGNQLVAGTANTSIGIRIQSPTGIQIGSALQGNSITTGTAASFKSAGMYLTAGHTIRNNYIFLGSTINASFATYTYGIEISSGGATAIIERNTIQGGSATSVSSAILVGINATSFNVTSSISGNYIRMGNANGTASTMVSGINLQSPSGFLVANNWIQNGSSNVYARGINISGVFSPLKIYHNTVSSGTSSVSGNEAVLQINSNSSVLVENNIFLLNDNAGNNACIVDLIGPQTSIRFNVFHNCSNLVYKAPLYYTDLCAGGVPGSLGCITPLGLSANFGDNLTLDPNLGLNFGVVANYIPTTATSCFITKSTNNIIADSYNGVGTRPGGDGFVSLGAIEYNLTCTP